MSPAINEAFAALAWADKGAIDQLYPHGVPCVVLEAVRSLDNGLSAGQAERMKEITDKGGSK